MAQIIAVKKLAHTGSIGKLFTYSVSEDATPLNPADSAGGVGQITLTAVQAVDDQYMLSRTFTLTDPQRGSVDGIVRGVAAAGGRTTLTAESALGALNTERTMPPYVGTLAGAFVTYLNAVGIGSVGVDVNGQAYTRIAPDAIYLDYPVAYPGWKGNVWEHIKMLCAATSTETALVDGIIVLRAPGMRSMGLASLTSIGTSVSSGGAAQTIEIYNQNTRPIPFGKEETVFTATSAYNVGVGEINKFRLVLDASLSTVYSPTPQASILGPNPSRPRSGAYAVSGSNGQPIPVKWWIDNGGRVDVALTENPFEVEVTITGPKENYGFDKADGSGGWAPFRLAEGEDAYPALYIAGVGVLTNKTLTTLKTGASAATTSNLVGATIDSPFITTKTEMLTAGLRAACAFAGPTKTLNFSEKHYDKGEQEFGLVGGSMVNYGTSRYRVKTATSDAGNITGSAESWVTAEDVSAAFAGKTFGQVNAIFSQMSFGEQAITPLKVT